MASLAAISSRVPLDVKRRLKEPIRRQENLKGKDRLRSKIAHLNTPYKLS